MTKFYVISQFQPNIRINYDHNPKINNIFSFNKDKDGEPAWFNYDGSEHILESPEETIKYNKEILGINFYLRFIYED